MFDKKSIRQKDFYSPWGLSHLRKEDGISSMLELSLVAPFLIALLIGVVDIHKACKHYLYLSQAVGQGALFAGGVPNIRGKTTSEQAAEINKTYKAGAGCSSSSTGAQGASHSKIRKEIEKYLMQNRDLRIANNSICIETTLLTRDADGNQNIRIKTTIGYDPIFPSFNQPLAISVESTSPYLL